MEHEWKFGDWARLGTDIARYIFNDGKLGFFLCASSSMRYFELRDSVYLPECTGWDWQPPKPIEAGEGYRFINILSDAPKENDEFWSEEKQEWIKRPFGIAFDGIRNNHNTFYRRKIEPQYRPFKDAEEFKPFSEKWLRHIKTDVVGRVGNYSDRGITTLDNGCWEFHTYEKCYLVLTFEDGSPFGVLVSE